MSQRAPIRAFEPEEVILGKYRVIRVIGAGGYGSVLEAENLRTTRHVAIKVVDGEALARSPTAARRLKVEARAAATISHPNSVDVLDLEEDPDGTMFFVQEYLRGETLHARLERDRKLPWREAFELMLPVMSALAEAHRKGIVHRDVKPENIFLSEAAAGVLMPKIIDFGIARVFDSGDLRLTQMDRVVGTPWYMSPEQAAGERELDGQTDVWAVGVVLYETISGSSPCVASNVEALMRAIARGELTPLRLRCPEVPPAVAACVERALVLDRKRRYATMGDFIDAALACLGARSVGIGRFTSATAPEFLAEAPPTSRSDAPLASASARTSVAPARERGDAEGDERTHSLTPSLRPAAPRPRSRGAVIIFAGMLLTAVAGFAIGLLATASAPAQVSTAPMRLEAAAPRAVAPRVAAPRVAAPVAPPAALAPPVAAPVAPPAVLAPSAPSTLDAGASIAPTVAPSAGDAARSRRRHRR